MLLCIEDTTTINEPEKWVSYQKALTQDEQDHFTNLDNPHEATAEQTGAYFKEAVYDRTQAVSYEKFQDFMRKQENKKKDTVTGDFHLVSFAVANGAPSFDLVAYPYEHYAKDVYSLSFEKVAYFTSAWTHSLWVDDTAIEANGNTSNTAGKIQYPNGDVEGVVIPNSVTHIGNNAFRNWLSNNQPLVIPNSVQTIGNSAFSNWRSNNQPLVIPDSVTSIGSHAFYEWRSNNQPLVIPYGVTTIGSYAFANWYSNNQPLVIPYGVTTIGSYAFSSWSSNNQPLVIPDSVTTIEDWAFRNWDANNQPLVIPNSVTTIGNSAF